MATISSDQLETFLSDLGLRRERLSSLVDAASDDEGLVAELTELGERLVVADEELRVQQEELEAIRLRLGQESGQREFLTSSVPMVQTDDRGVVLGQNLAAMRLVGLPASSTRSTALVSWFATHDRFAVRSLINGVARSPGASSVAGLRLRSGADVTAQVRRSKDDVGVTLHWELRAEDDHPLVAPAAPDLLTEDLAALALDLAEERTALQVLAAASTVSHLVPGAAAVTLSVLGRGGVEAAVGSSREAESCEAQQHEAGRGPAVDASDRPGTVVVVGDLASDPRWPDIAHLAHQRGWGSSLSLAAALPTVHRTAVLTWYGREVDALTGQEPARVATLTAAHVCAALDRSLHEDDLRAAVTSRQRIGEAVGMLAERESIDRGAAFALLVRRSQSSHRKLSDVAALVSEEHG